MKDENGFTPKKNQMKINGIYSCVFKRVNKRETKIRDTFKNQYKGYPES